MIKCTYKESVLSQTQWLNGQSANKQNKELNSLCVHAVQAYVHPKVVLRKYATDNFVAVVSDKNL